MHLYHRLRGHTSSPSPGGEGPPPGPPRGRGPNDARQTRGEGAAGRPSLAAPKAPQWWCVQEPRGQDRGLPAPDVRRGWGWRGADEAFGLLCGVWSRKAGSRCGHRSRCGRGLGALCRAGFEARRTRPGPRLARLCGTNGTSGNCSGPHGPRGCPSCSRSTGFLTPLPAVWPCPSRGGWGAGQVAGPHNGESPPRSGLTPGPRPPRWGPGAPPPARAPVL